MLKDLDDYTNKSEMVLQLNNLIEELIKAGLSFEVSIKSDFLHKPSSLVYRLKNTQIFLYVSKKVINYYLTLINEDDVDIDNPTEYIPISSYSDAIRIIFKEFIINEYDIEYLEDNNITLLNSFIKEGFIEKVEVRSTNYKINRNYDSDKALEKELKENW